MKYKRILSLLLAFITVSTVFTAIPFTVSAAENSESIMVGASSGTTGDCTWTLNGTELIISGEGAMGDYHDLTDTHDTVARIETDAPWFGFQQNIKSVVIKHGVTSVGNYAFYCCLSLSSVTIPDTVTRIGDYAFGYCDSLNSITVPNSVLSIGEYAFDSNITVYGVTGGTTGGCKWMLMDGTMTISGNGAIPDYSSYKKVPWRAYESEIRNIRIQNGITGIGTYAFDSLSELQSVSFGTTLKSIGKQAFARCNKLQSVYLPDGLSSIGIEAFYACRGMQSIYLPSTLLSIGSGALNYCDSLLFVNIPGNVTYIGARAFESCSNIRKITIPSSVTYIGDNAFSYCTGLESMFIPENVSFIGNGILSGASNVRNISVSSVNNNYDSRNNCNAIIETSTNSLICACKNTTVPFGVTKIAAYAFYEITGLKKLYIPDSVTEIGNSAFGKCFSLENIRLSDNLEKISNGTFYLCAALKSITLPYSVKTIEGAAFYGCSELSGMIIPQSVTSIHTQAIGNCNKLTIYGYSGTNAEIYANSKGIPFSSLNKTDTDGDGLPDEWEINGVDYDGDGTIDVNLPLMGADPNVPDIFVEVDWMVRPQENFLWFETQKNRNMAPSSGAMRLVYNAFRNHGINLHIDVGPNSTDFVTGRQWGNLSGGNEIPYEKMYDINTSWEDTVNSNFSKNRYSVFKHCLFIDQFDGTTSGIANDIPGQYFIVANQDWVFNGGDTSVGGTFMHELGHTLGLRHGGSDNEHYKPNYLSVMNYAFQTTGLVGTGTISYSDYKLPDIDEAHINENLGVDPFGLTSDTGLGTTIFFRDSAQREFSPISGTAIDFNNNGFYESDISIDLNPNGKVYDSSIAVLRGHQDWNGIVFDGGDIGKQTVFLSGFDFSIDEMGQKEKTLEESLNTSTLANDNTGYIDLLPSALIAGLGNQYLEFEIGNLSGKTSSYTVNVVCDALFDSFSETVEIQGSKDKIELKHILVPITKPVKKAQYNIMCSISSGDNNIDFVYNIESTIVSRQDIICMKQQMADDSILDVSDTERITELLSTYESEGIIGDVNGDGYININDVTALQRHLANIMTLTSDQLAVADANGDGVVDINDATYLQMYLAEYNVALGKQS